MVVKYIKTQIESGDRMKKKNKVKTLLHTCINSMWVILSVFGMAWLGFIIIGKKTKTVNWIKQGAIYGIIILGTLLLMVLLSSNSKVIFLLFIIEILTIGVSVFHSIKANNVYLTKLKRIENLKENEGILTTEIEKTDYEEIVDREYFFSEEKMLSVGTIVIIILTIVMSQLQSELFIAGKNKEYLIATLVGIVLPIVIFLCVIIHNIRIKRDSQDLAECKEKKVVEDIKNYIFKLKSIIELDRERIFNCAIERVVEDLSLLYSLLLAHDTANSKCKKLIKYYLPEMINLIDAYDKQILLEKKQKSILKIQGAVEASVKSVESAIESIVESILEQETFETVTEAKALQSIIQQDGYIDGKINV